MALSMTEDFRSEDIHTVKELKDMKVWLLQNLDGEKLVIKIDAVGRDQIKDANRVAKNVDPTARVKILSKSEEFALQNWCRIHLEVTEFYEGLGFTARPEFYSDSQAVKNLQEQVANLGKFPEPFVKMRAMTLHNLEDAVSERGKGNKQIVRDYVHVLKENGGLERLGQVVAVDMFNNNTDRFYPGSGKVEKIGPYDLAFKCLVNIKNVFIALNDSGEFKVTALDFVDPNFGMKRDEQGVPIGLKTIVQTRTRKAFAEDIVADLEACLHPKKSKWSLKDKLGRSAASRVDKGICQGMGQIKNYFQTKQPSAKQQPFVGMLP